MKTNIEKRNVKDELNQNIFIFGPSLESLTKQQNLKRRSRRENIFQPQIEITPSGLYHNTYLRLAHTQL